MKGLTINRPVVSRRSYIGEEGPESYGEEDRGQYAGGGVEERKDLEAADSDDNNGCAESLPQAEGKCRCARWDSSQKEDTFELASGNSSMGDTGTRMEENRQPKSQ